MKRPVAIAFGRVLRQARRAARLSQEALAEYADLSPAYLSMLERGLRTPTLRVLFALSIALDVELEALVTETRAYLPCLGGLRGTLNGLDMAIRRVQP